MFGIFASSKSGQASLLAAAVAGIGLASASPAYADAFTDLFSSGAGNYAVFELGGSPNLINLSAVTVNGSVATVTGGKIMNMSPSSITGNVYEAASGQYSGPGHLGGSQIIDPSAMLLNYNGAVQAATDAANAVPTYTVNTDITTATNYTAAAGQTVVIDLSGNINLNNANLTLSGTATSHFIVNITGNLSLTGTASLVNSGVPLSNIIYNFTNATNGIVNTHVGDTVDGIMLAGSGCGGWTLDGTFNGALIAKCNINLLSNATVNGLPPQQVPEPPTLLLFATSLLGFGWLARRKLSQ